MSRLSRRLLLVVGLDLVAGPVDFAAWHHSLWGVAYTVLGAWLVALVVVR